MDRKGGNRRGSRPPHRRTPHQIGNHARALLSRLSAEASVLVLRCGTDDTRRRGAGAIRFLRSKSDEYGSLTGETMERLSEGRSAARASPSVKPSAAPIAAPREHSEEAKQQILPPVPGPAMALF